MNLSEILARIEIRLKAIGLTPNAASNAAKKPDSIRNLQRAVKDGKRSGISTSTIAALAPVLKTTSAWLISGEGLETVSDDAVESIDDISTSVWVKSYVQAGEWSDNPEWPIEKWEEIPITPIKEYPKERLHACRVRGTSMNKVFPEGTILIWVETISVREPPVSGRRYIIQRSRYDGQEYELTVKTYIKNESGRYLMCESNDPEYQGSIKLANGTADSVQIIGRVVRSIRDE